MKLAEMTSPEVQAIANGTASVVAVLPIGATEQHGPHLAVSTDTAIVTEIAERAEAALAKEVLLCPTMGFGASHHHRAFPGTLSFSPELYTNVLVEMVQSLLQSGLRRIVLLNGHGGNIAPGRQALAMLSARSEAESEPNIALATYSELGGKYFTGEPPLQTPCITHACEYETSMMLHLYPERVHMERAERARIAPSNNYIGWENEVPYRGVCVGWQSHLTGSNGSSGHPQLATAAKGKHLIERATDATIDFLRDFQTWPFLHDMRQ